MAESADPLKVNCGVCGDVCKRGVKVTCCQARACRNCAVKHITKNKSCWKSACTKVVSTDVVENDEDLRALVDSLEDSDLINCSVCDEICKRGAILSCCKAPCCRSCGVKKVTADRKCWMEGCGALGLKSEDLQNDDLLRSAVDHYKNNGAMDPNHLNTLKKRKEKNVEILGSNDQNGKDSDDESMEIVSVDTAKNVDIGDKTTNNSISFKRKSPAEKSGGIKKAKWAGMKSDVVFLEMEMVHSYNKGPQTLQIGLSTSSEKGKPFFMQPVSNPVVENIKLSSVLNTLNLFRAGEKLLFRDKSGKKMECKTEKESLQGALSFLQEAKSSYVGPPVTLVTYRNVTIAHFVTALKRQGLQGRFQNIVGRIISLEEIFEEKDVWALLPMKPLNKVFSSVMGTTVSKSNPTCDEMAKNLRLVVTKLAEKHDFDLVDLSKPVQDVLKKFTNLDVTLPVEPNTYTTENSCNFNSATSIDAEEDDDDEIEEIQEIQVVKKTISSPKMKHNRFISEKGTVELVFRSLSFPVYNQPILAELKNAKKSVDFVKIQVSPSMAVRSKYNNWKIPKTDALKVHWMQGKAYVLAPIHPQQELSLKNNSHEVKPFEDFKAKTILGDYEACEGIPLISRPIKLVVIKTGKNENVNIGPKPTAIMVKIENLSPNVKITPSHALMVASLDVQGVTLVTKFFGVNNNNAASGQARIVVQAKGEFKSLKNGQQFGTAFLVSEKNISRVVDDAKSSQDIFATILEDSATESSMSKGVSPKLLNTKGSSPMMNARKVPSILSKQRKMCNTVALTRLYARGSNPVLVKLDANSTDSKKFHSASIQFSPKFKELIEADRAKKGKNDQVEWKEKESSKKCRVLWKEESTSGKGGGKSSVPYAFIDVSILSAPGGFRGAAVAPRYIDLSKAFDIASYVPAEGDAETFVDLSMSICVDFTERNWFVNNEPKSIEVYLKFKDTEIEKEKVKDQVFFIEGCYNDRVEILTKVFKTKSGNRLAPQKTSTNDMKATLVMRARYPEDEVRLAGREVIAITKAASPSVNLVKLCAVSGDGAKEELPAREAAQKERYDEFGDPEIMICNEGGNQRNQQRGLNEVELNEMEEWGMRQQRRRKDDFNEMREQGRYEDSNDIRESRMNFSGRRREEQFREMQPWGGKREEDLDDMEMMRMRMKRLDEGHNSGHDDDFNDMEMMRMRMKGLDEGYPSNSGYRGNGRMYEEHLGNGRYHGKEEYQESRRYEDDVGERFQARGFQSRFADNSGRNSPGVDESFQARGFQSRFADNSGNYSPGGGAQSAHGGGKGIDLRGSSVFEMARQKLNGKKDPWDM